MKLMGQTSNETDLSSFMISRDSKVCYSQSSRMLVEMSMYNKWHFTFIPSSQEIQRSPLVKKQATACLAKWCIQPSSLSCVMIASIQGNPVWPCPTNVFYDFFMKTQEITDDLSINEFTHVCPLGKCFDILVPRDLHANWITLHPIEIWVLRSSAVKKFTP